MPKPKSPRATKDKDSDQPKAHVAAIQGLAKIFNTLVETFGWAGTLIILGFWFVVWYATPEQKQRIIELYVLGTGISHVWPLIALSVIFTATVVAQRRWYLKKVEILRAEIEREGREKSLLQAELAGRQLQHAATKTELKGK